MDILQPGAMDGPGSEVEKQGAMMDILPQWFVLLFDVLFEIQGMIIILLAIWGLRIAARRSNAMEKRNENDDKRRNDERYAKCVELLGAKNLATVLGAVHGLRHLAWEWERYRGEVVETFCAYVRAGEAGEKAGENNASHRDEVVSAMLKALGQIPGGFQIDLTDGIFHKMRIGDLNLKGGADFSRASFIHFTAEKANLSGALFQECALEKVVFEDANLQGVGFFKGSMQDVRIINSNMSDARIDKVDMSGVTLGGVDFRGGFLCGIRLSSESWTGMDFRDAEFVDCKFASVHFHGSNFEGCDMAGAEFSGCNFAGCSFHMARNLTYDHLESARSLRDAQGLPQDWEKRLRREKPELFGELSQ